MGIVTYADLPRIYKKVSPVIMRAILIVITTIGVWVFVLPLEAVVLLGNRYVNVVRRYPHARSALAVVYAKALDFR